MENESENQLRLRARACFLLLFDCFIAGKESLLSTSVSQKIDKFRFTFKDNLETIKISWESDRNDVRANFLLLYEGVCSGRETDYEFGKEELDQFCSLREKFPALDIEEAIKSIGD